MDSALDCGISEFDFWNMTIAEVKRAIDSSIRVEKRKAQQQAMMDYISAELIGRSVGRFLVTKEMPYPTVEEAYPSLFEDKAKQREEEKALNLAKLSALRFKQYANFHNNKFNKGGGNVK